MKLRIVRKQNSGFAPYYELQNRYCFIWFLIGWSSELAAIEQKRDSMLANEKTLKPAIIWSN